MPEELVNVGGSESGKLKEDWFGDIALVDVLVLASLWDRRPS
jgi:hypothetical protein